jgi:putative flippase GtrA
MLKDRITALDKKYGIFRAAKFGVAGAVGFGVLELILLIGVYGLYHNFNVPADSYSSVPLIELSILASVIGVSANFFINEAITVRNAPSRQHGMSSLTVRYLKFQAVYALGNGITIGIELGLLKTIDLSPVLGGIIGAIVAFPISYFISMRFVWKINPTVGQQSSEQSKSMGKAQ